MHCQYDYVTFNYTQNGSSFSHVKCVTVCSKKMYEKSAKILIRI